MEDRHKSPLCGDRSYFGNLAGSLFIVFLLDETLLFHGAAAPVGLASAMAVSVAKVAGPLHPPTFIPKRFSYHLALFVPAAFSAYLAWVGVSMHSHSALLHGSPMTNACCMPLPPCQGGGCMHLSKSPSLIRSREVLRLPA